MQWIRALAALEVSIFHCLTTNSAAASFEAELSSARAASARPLSLILAALEALIRHSPASTAALILEALVASSEQTPALTAALMLAALEASSEMSAAPRAVAQVISEALEASSARILPLSGTVTVTWMSDTELIFGSMLIRSSSPEA